MISYLLIIIISYFFFALSFLGDKLILSGTPKASLYTFYATILGGLVIFLIPFLKFTYPDTYTAIWIILEAIVYIAGLYTMFLALEKFEVSRVMTTIGATQPIIILFLTWIFWGFKALSIIEIFAFVLLLAGSILISIERKTKKKSGYVVVTILSALFFSLDFIFQKLVYLRQPFLQGFVLMKIFSVIFILLFFFSKNLRKEVFAVKKNIVFDKKTMSIFLSSQACGGVANCLQSFAIFLAPAAFLPILNSLRGMQYIFLFLMIVFISAFFPKILKEGTQKNAIIQKIISIIIISAGLALVVLY